MLPRRFIFAVSTSVILVIPSSISAGLKSIKLPFVNNVLTSVSLVNEKLLVINYRMSLDSTISKNPFKPGSGPTMLVSVRNDGPAPSDFGLAVALFDKEGNLVGAGTAAQTGKLDPGETREIKIIFRDLNLSIADAAAIYLAIETKS